jgi:hypothetical protein
MRSHDFTSQASLFKCRGNIPAYITQCYSDTYGITFNMEDAWVIVNELYMYFNNDIYLSTFDRPYLFYSTNNKFNDYYQRQTCITNSIIKGPRSTQKLYYSNTENVGMKVNYNNVINVEGYKPYTRLNFLTDKNNTPNINSFVTNDIIVKNGFVYLNICFQIEASTSKTFLLGDLPNWIIPNREINAICSYGNNGIKDAVDGCGILKIYDNKIRGNVNNASGNQVYVKINLVYPINSEFTGS